MDEISTYYQIVETAFAKMARYYDLIILPIAVVRERAADLIASGGRLRILDVATGTGAQAFAFARRGHNVVGVDLSDSMIRVAQKKNLHRIVTFEVADATHLPYPNDSFDVTTISFALHDMPLTIREKVLSEMVRVTKPQGRIVIVDYDLPRNRLGRFLIYRLVRLYERDYYTEFIKSDLGGLLRQVGIEIVQSHPVLLGAARIIKGLPSRSTTTEAN
jgi:demethylmenaquinone methyltransferase/2-methoxy-6-polyprenyl-1,4-benzoquinol methylase